MTAILPAIAAVVTPWASTSDIDAARERYIAAQLARLDAAVPPVRDEKREDEHG